MMNRQTVRLAGVSALPWNKPATRQAMLKIVGDIGGPVDLNPARRYSGADHAILLDAGRLLVAGTRAATGVGLVDYAEAAKRNWFDLLLVRCGGCEATYDIYLHQCGRWLTGYRRAYRGGSFWLYPPEHSGLPFIEATARGLALSRSAPFADQQQFDAQVFFGNRGASEWKEAA